MGIIIPKKFFTFGELMARWQCEEADIVHVILHAGLVPSLFIYPGKYARYEMVDDPFLYASEGRVYPRAVFDWDLESEDFESRDFCSGLHFLIEPRHLSTTDCLFSYFCEKPRDHDIGDLCHELTSPFGMLDVMLHGVFMNSEVIRFEELHTQEEQGGQQRPATTSADKKLTPQQEAEIVAAYDRGRGLPVNQLSKQYGVSRPTIDKVLKESGVKT